MVEEIYQIIKYSMGHKVNRQLLVSIEELLKQTANCTSLHVETKCTNDTLYKFENIDECFSFFETSSCRIERLELIGTSGKECSNNSITITFDNGLISPHTEIKFKFDSTDKYLLLKNKIELCLKNFRTRYRILSVLPIIPIISTTGFWAICTYTNNNNIIFPKTVQYLITIIWVLSLLFVLTPFAKRQKRNLFPCTEFWIGQNSIIEQKNSSTRNFLIGTLILSPLLGIIVDFISHLLFK